jgi:thioesterase III
MWNEQKDKIKSVLWSNFVHVNMKTQRPENHSKDLMELFLPFENPLPTTLGFDERLEQIKTTI